MLKYLILGLLLVGCPKKDPKTIFVNREKEAEKAWKMNYVEKIKWVKPCENGTSKYYKELIMACEGKKWSVKGVI